MSIEGADSLTYSIKHVGGGACYRMHLSANDTASEARPVYFRGNRDVPAAQWRFYAVPGGPGEFWVASVGRDLAAADARALLAASCERIQGRNRPVTLYVRVAAPGGCPGPTSTTRARQPVRSKPCSSET